MARSVSIKYGGKNVRLVASFGAARDISANVHDLLGLFNDQQRALIFLQMGRPYQPQFNWSLGSVAQVIETGLQYAGVDADRDGVAAFMVEIGLDAAQRVAQDYLSLFFAQPETEGESAKAGDDTPKK